MRLSEEQERPLTINLVPMIDVIFAVLAFFIISTLFLTRSEGLPVNYPRCSASSAWVVYREVCYRECYTGKRWRTPDG